MTELMERLGYSFRDVAVLLNARSLIRRSVLAYRSYRARLRGEESRFTASYFRTTYGWEFLRANAVLGTLLSRSEYLLLDIIEWTRGRQLSKRRARSVMRGHCLPKSAAEDARFARHAAGLPLARK